MKSVSQTHFTINRNPNMKCFVSFGKNALTRYGKKICSPCSLVNKIKTVV